MSHDIPTHSKGFWMGLAFSICKNNSYNVISTNILILYMEKHGTTQYWILFRLWTINLRQIFYFNLELCAVCQTITSKCNKTNRYVLTFKFAHFVPWWGHGSKNNVVRSVTLTVMSDSIVEVTTRRNYCHRQSLPLSTYFSNFY